MPSSRSYLFAAVTLFLLTVLVSSQTRKKPVGKPAQAAANREQDREGIELLQKRDIAASMAFDVNQFLELWADDGVLLAPHHQPIIGKAALRKFVEEKHDQYANYDMLAYNEEWNEVMVVGDYAYQWGTVTIRMKPPTGSEAGYAVHAIRILKRDQDVWRVARAMWNEAAAAGQ